MTGAEVLEFALPENDAGAKTVRQYLVALATVLWEEGEGVSGKRPFGNSGWQYEMIDALIDGGVANDERDAKRLVGLALKALAEGGK